MTRITRRIAFFLSLPLTAIGCQSAVGPAAKPPDARTAAALQASDRATAELAHALTAVDNARAVVRHNMSNVDSTGYKATRARCQDGGGLTCQLDLTQGSLENTGRPLDVGIQGQGFFKIRLGYSRNGNFVVNKSGELVLNIGDGCKLIPPVIIPPSATDVTIGVDGTVTVLLAGQTTKQTAGTLKLTQFRNPGGLELRHGSISHETESSGPPTDFTPGDGGTGQLLQGFLENSNVDIHSESARLRYLDQWRAELLRAGERD